MTNVYAWPPVGNVASEWTRIAPIGRSRSLITGASYVSAAQRRRRVASLDVSALSLDRNGAGYIEVLKQLLDGGVHLVRLYSTPIHWHLDDEAENAARARPMSWIVPPDPVAWDVGATEFGWTTLAGEASGTALPGNRVRVTGLSPLRLAARPGEFVRMGGVTAMVRRPARADADGEVILDLVTPLLGSGAIHIGARDTGVFEADEMPRAKQPLGQNWTYSWSFTEVFEDERGPFVEVDPWT